MLDHSRLEKNALGRHVDIRLEHALPLRQGQFFADHLPLTRINERSHIYGFIHRLTDAQLGHPQFETIHKVGVYAFLHDQARPSATHLPAIEPYRIHDTLNSAV